MRIKTGQLIDQYQDPLFAAAFNICNPADADDAVQDTFLQYHLPTKHHEPGLAAGRDAGPGGTYRKSGI